MIRDKIYIYAMTRWRSGLLEVAVRVLSVQSRPKAQMSPKCSVKANVDGGQMETVLCPLTVSGRVMLSKVQKLRVILFSHSLKIR